ncbi:Diacetyl reductase [(S)-acetoin forming] [Seminavis robusta]|uniref:Diacetyl reductase [(S)-acetoin forming] n=1 Tax=Seminavis robusta TaxID=568900 RepID=A0A9N8EYD9_9STRA|nr:Diacetyl reductase [(S)-acetoin forming] [Seminavis robusta]|eukprot:Sro1926_g305900.1 Diacetyl reductase [(S)-acetoin forming] (275) ;mRNA; r:11782-12606
MSPIPTNTSNKDKVILITGASAGIGLGTAQKLASEGAILTLFARRGDKLLAAEKELKAAYPNVKTLAVVGDAAKEEDVKRAVEETVNAFGGIHGAFINAGIYRPGKLTEMSNDDMNALLDVNVKGVIYSLRHIIPAIKKTVGDSQNGYIQQGSIVVNSSCMATAVIAPKSAGSSIYSATKAFVNSIVETAAIEEAPLIRINSVMPGVVKTEVIPLEDEAYEAFAAKMQPLYGRAGTPQEIANVVSFLLGPGASFISGTNVKADGLWSLSGGSLE